ncbi:MULTISPECIES: D-Ala-D-Ala carboxypeptidase family metallohydrolase [unclassified Moraxella]|uniref:D-Ala-D-Ala carboxypeptidase family metallohydrolase n=1 Tax=unclassified Moraxella TaxID=2685852 RepID=UPI003AF41BFC
MYLSKNMTNKPMLLGASLALLFTGLAGCATTTVNQTTSKKAPSKNAFPIYQSSVYQSRYPIQNTVRGVVSQQKSYQGYQVVPKYTPTHDASTKTKFLKTNKINSHNPAFNYWLENQPYHKPQVLAYQGFLETQVNNLPPIDELVVSARDAVNCGYEPYEVPPVELWRNIVPTLQLVERLKQQGYLPRSTVIRSVYRNPSLNRCAGGAGESKHTTNGAIDIWIPENDGNRWAIDSTFDGLCQFWQSQGQDYNFGLGLYATGSIHIDTQGYRKWGGNHSSSSSPCRF